jgi:hypothetical protein
MADLVRGSAAEVKRRQGGSRRTERGVHNDDTVSFARPARELGVSKQVTVEYGFTQRLRYRSEGQGSAPPVAHDLSPSSVLKLVAVVGVRVMPFVAFPDGSMAANRNSTRASLVKGLKRAGVDATSGFWLP